MRDWAQPRVETRKAAIKQELDAVEERLSTAKRLQHCLAAVRRLGQQDGKAAARDRYIYIVSALVHHLRQGGLARRDVERLFELAHAILEVQGIRPGVSRLTYLYAELHILRGQFHSQQGEHWAAAWEQQAARRLGGRPPDTQKVFLDLSAGLRELRLGHSKLAITRLEQCYEILQGDHRLRCGLALIRAYRILGAFDKALELIEQMNRETESIRFIRELDWEELIIEALEEDDFSELIARTRKRQSHYSASYLMETFLWAYAAPSLTWVERMVNMATVANNRKLAPRDAGFPFIAAKVLAQCYDKDRPLSQRIRALGNTLARVAEAPTIDREALVLAGAVRWLDRSQSQDMAALTLQEYRSLSLRISNGAADDCLGIMGDVIARYA